MALPAGTRLGLCEILVQLNAGGMGEVYKAHRFIITRDARSYAYGYMRFLDELYLVEGLK